MNLKSIDLKKLSFKTSCLGLIFTTACMGQMSESYHNPKVGFNGGFEVIQNNLPVNWLVYTQHTTKEGQFSIQSDSSVYFAGKKSLRLDIEKCSDKGGRFSPGIAQELKVNAGETYEIKARIRNQDTKFTLHASAVNAFHHGPIVDLVSLSSGNEWIEYRTSIQIPEKMESLRLELNVLSPGNLWIDDVQINRIP